MNRIYLSVILFATMIFVGGCEKMGDKFDPARNDAYCSRLLAKPGSEDLFQWLSKNDDVERTLGEFATQVESEGFALELQVAGAESVWAIDIDRASKDVQFENTGKLCVLLPAVQEQRVELLELANEIAEELGFESVPDKQQRYLYIGLD